MRLRIGLIAVVGLFVAAGCGGSSGESGGAANGVLAREPVGAAGRGRGRDPRHERLRPRRRTRVVPRRLRERSGRPATACTRMARPEPHGRARPGDRGAPRASRGRGLRGRGGRRPLPVRHDPPRAATRDLVVCGRADRRPPHPGARAAAGAPEDVLARDRVGGARLEDADAREHGRRPGRALDRDRSRAEALRALRRPGARCEGAVRRRLRNAEVLPEPRLRPGRRRGRRHARGVRAARRPLHPRRGLPGQRPDEGRQPVDEGVEPPDRAVGVRRRRRRQDRGEVRGLGLRRRAARGDRARRAPA